MIRAEGLTKEFGEAVAVSDLSFEAQPGRVTAILGPEGAGKTTALRMLVGLVHPTGGRAEILGAPYRELDGAARRVGAVIGERLHPRRTVREHLRVCAALVGVDGERVDEVMDDTGLHGKGDRRPGELREGMRLRLSLAAALLGEPEVLIVDDPARGLSPEGIAWLRRLLDDVVGEGEGTVLVAARELAQVSELGDHVLLMEAGSIVAEAPVRELVRRAGSEVVVRSPGAEVLAAQLERSGVGATRVSSEELRAREVAPSVLSDLAVASGLPLWEVRTETPSLEALFEAMTSSNGDGSHGDDGEGLDRETLKGLNAADEALDRDLARLPAIDGTRVVAVAAPEGAQGATTVSFLMADVLAGCASTRTLAIALGLDSGRFTLPAPEERRSTLHVGELLRDLRGFDDAARIAPYVSVSHSGLHTLAGLPGREQLELVGPDELADLIAFASRFYELLVLDLGELGEPALRATMALADEVVLVGSLESAEGQADSALLDLIDGERDQRSTLVMNRVEPSLAAERAARPRGSYAVVPEDRELIRALDEGDFRLDEQAAITRVALKRLGLVVGEGLK